LQRFTRKHVVDPDGTVATVRQIAYRVFLGVEVLDKDDSTSPEGGTAEDKNRIDGNETEQGVLDSKSSFVLGFPLRAPCPIWGSSVYEVRQRRKHP
jgi:hypothetical protein